MVGHGESDLEDQEGPDGLGTFREWLQELWFEVETLNLGAVSQVPTDADALVIAGPRGTGLSGQENERVGRYLEQGGALLLDLGMLQRNSGGGRAPVIRQTQHLADDEQDAADGDDRLRQPHGHPG